MQSNDSFTLACGFNRTLLSLLTLCLALPAFAQTREQYFARRNSFGVLGAYANDSSHILLGDAEQRKLLSFGVSYSRRLFLDHIVNWQYDAEILPVALESDPLTKFVNQQTSPTPETFTGAGLPPMTNCAPIAFSYTFVESGVTYSGTQTYSCSGRQWTIGEAMSPVGLQWNFMPRAKTQPFLDAHGGYMYSTHPIPIASSGSFNFTFDFGAGVELYRSLAQSVRVQYRYHHISNHNTALYNPGIDNGEIQLSYVFGR